MIHRILGTFHALQGSCLAKSAMTTRFARIEIFSRNAKVDGRERWSLGATGGIKLY